MLSKYVKYVYDHYFNQVKKGNDKPRWDYDADIMKVDLSNIDEIKHRK